MTAVLAVTLSAGFTNASATTLDSYNHPRPVRDNVVIRWNQAGLQAVISSGMGPPMVARGLAILHTCMYDAWAAYDRRAAGTRLGTRLRQPAHQRTFRNKNEAISFAAYTAATELWPAQASQFNGLLADLGYRPTDRTRASRTGVRACNAVLRYRRHDGANQLGDLAPGAYSDYTGYTPTNLPMDIAKPLDPSTIKDPSRWQPLTINGSDGLPQTSLSVAPHFGNVKPFAMRSWDQFKLPPPAEYGSPEYRRQANELIRFAARLTDRQKAITEYWADEGPGFVSPPGTWSRISQFVSRRDHHTLDQDAKMFFAVTNAVFDASIAVWGYKRHYDSVRPITAIRYLYRDTKLPSWRPAGGRPTLIDGSMWMPYQPPFFVTPSFAEFPSGHAAFGAAAGEVLKSFTGSDAYGGKATLPAGSSRVEPGISPRTDITLSWPTFSAAVDENAVSRRYGGLHFKDADLYGRRLGRQTGAKAWTLSTRYFAGRHHHQP